MGIKRTAAGRIYYDAEDDRQSQVLGLLGQIGDRLQRSDSEREALSRELSDYRKIVADLEDKAAKAEKIVASVSGKIGKVDQIESEFAKRQEAFDRAAQEHAQKIARAVQAQADVERRLIAAENAAASFESRIAETVDQQGRLNRKLEKMAQDKIRLLRKLERMEEIVAETQDALRAKAMVLLTDQSFVAGAVPALPPSFDSSGKSGKDLDFETDSAPLWRKPVRLQVAVLGVVVVLSVLCGWIAGLGFSSPSGMSSGAIEPIRLERGAALIRAVPEKGATALADSSAGRAAPGLESVPRLSNSEGRTVTLSASLPDPLSASDREMAAAFEADPQALGARLNEIEPSASLHPVPGNPAQAPVPNPREITAENAVASNPAPRESEKPVVSKEKARVERVSLPPARSAAEKVAPKTSDVKAEALDSSAVAGLAQMPAPGEMASPESDKTARNLSPSVAPASSPPVRVVDVSPDPALPPAVKDTEEKALAGVAEAQHDLAAIYTAGRGSVKQNYEKAAFWFGKAARQGISNAQYNLGVLYQQGLGVPRDMKEAIKWYRSAADLGHPEARYNLGIAYIEGVGVPYDPARAASYFEMAAAGGVTEAAYNLGLIHENGLLGKPGPDEALLWYKKAADKGNADAKAALEQLAKSLRIAPEDLDRVVRQSETEALLNAGETGISSGVGSGAKEKTKARGEKREAVPSMLPPPPPPSGEIGAVGLAQKTAALSGSLDQVIISQIQDQLKDMGMYNGASDGTLGPMTADAIRSYQSRNGLPVDGQATESLLIHMLAREIRD